MYTVNLKDVFTKEIRTIHDINSIDKNSSLISGKISDAINEISSFEFEILPNNIGFNFIEPFRSQVEVYDNKAKKYAFKGRVLIPSISMSQDGNIVKDVTCESFLGYLNDVYTPIAEEQTYELDNFIDLLLNHYNSKVEDYKKIYKGTINVQTFASGNTVTKSLDGTQTIYEAIQEKLIDSFGGEIQVVEDSQGILYFNYIQEIGITNEDITIEVGRNMKTATKEVDPTNIYTRLYPYGAKLTKTYINDEGEEVTEETEERLTIESVNNNIPYIEDEQAYSQFKTTLEHAEIFDDITVAENLKTKAEEWLTNNNKVQQKHTISYVDLFKLGIDTSDIELYNYYHIINPLIGIDEMLRVIKKTTDIIDVNSSSIDVGDVFKTLTDIEVERQQQIISTINTVQQINKNYTTNLDLSNLKNYMTSYINQTAEELLLGVENMISLSEYIKTVTQTNVLELENTQISSGMIYNLSIKGFYEHLLYPGMAYPSKDLFPGYYTRYDIIQKNEENENIDTIILKEPLRTLEVDGIKYYDEIVIENNRAYIYRNIGLDENGEKILLNSTDITLYGDLQLDTFENNTEIYVKYFDNLIYSSTYMQKNPFTNIFITQIEAKSSLNITKDEILSKVESTYVTQNELITAKSEISQTINGINLTVSSKVGKDEIISSINQTAEAIKINANKINLSANDVLNILAGSQINLTTGNITINSDNFKVTKNGQITCTAGTIGGFTLGSTSFSSSFSGIYDFTYHELKIVQAEVLGRIEIPSVLSDILDVNNDNNITSADYMTIKNILLGTAQSTKTVSGSLTINTKDPKNNIVIEKGSTTVVGIGAGGIDTIALSSEIIVCGSRTGTESSDFDGILMDGNSVNMSFVCAGVTNITLDGSNGTIEASGSITSRGNLFVDYGYIRSSTTYSGETVTGTANLYITSSGNIRRTTGSSQRWKKDITENIEERLNPNVLYNLPIKQFKYKENIISKNDARYEQNILGFIAEDVAEIYEPAVQYDEKGQVEMWNAQVIIPAMLKLVQDLKKRVDVIESEVS